jgi:NAD(P)-dependent dehydrogenase (short-subunit alcohol dehydrogenase family)
VGDSLKGRTALITGGARGIGRAIAEGFAREGANVVITARSGGLLDEVAATIETLGVEALAIAADVGERDAVFDIVRRTENRFGGIDILVNNAAAPSVNGPLVDFPIEAWRHIQSVNTEAALSLMQAAGPGMLSRGSGSVIIVSSTLGMNGNPNSSAYGASKAALNHMTRTAAAEWGPSGVRVNGLIPGPTATERVEMVTSDAAKSELIVNLMPIRRWPTAEDMVGPAVFLASDASAAVTGHLLVVDGGLGAIAREAGIVPVTPRKP